MSAELPTRTYFRLYLPLSSVHCEGTLAAIINKTCCNNDQTKYVHRNCNSNPIQETQNAQVTINLRLLPPLQKWTNNVWIDLWTLESNYCKIEQRRIGLDLGRRSDRCVWPSTFWTVQVIDMQGTVSGFPTDPKSFWTLHLDGSRGKTEIDSNNICQGCIPNWSNTKRHSKKRGKIPIVGRNTSTRHQTVGNGLRRSPDQTTRTSGAWSTEITRKTPAA